MSEALQAVAVEAEKVAVDAAAAVQQAVTAVKAVAVPEEAWQALQDRLAELERACGIRAAV